jgi:Ca-activated chloride channel family protein
MKFADPYLLLLLLAVPALLLLKTRLWRDAARTNFSDLGLFAGARSTWRLRFRWLPTLFRACALALLVIALARPQKAQAQTELPGQGIDIALVLDTSSSMSTTSFGADSRLAVAQRVIKDFISGRKDDRIGLVIFQNESLVLSPLTLDYDALKSLLDNVRSVNLNDGTAIGLGVGESLNLLRESRARSRVAILLTDGENNNTTLQPLAAAKIAETLGIRLYTIGVIDPRTRGRTGANVDEQALTQMAITTGGRYFSADSPQALAGVYQNIDQLEKSRVGRLQFASYDELAVYFLAGAVAILAAELALSATVWRRAI